MTANERFVTSVEVAWSLLLPTYAIPNIKIVTAWRRYYTIDQVIEGITTAAEYINKRSNLSDDVAGRIVSSTIRKIAERSQCQSPAS